MARATKELLPCPFCGGKARMLDMLASPAKFLAVCGNPDCLFNHPAPTPEFAAKAWNTRAERTCRYVKDPDTLAELCSECGALAIEDWTADYCWACGAKVVY